MDERESKVVNGRLHVRGGDGEYHCVPLGMDEARTMKGNDREVPFSAQDEQREEEEMGL